MIRTKHFALLALAFGLAYFLIGYLFLVRGFPHEDAYILFKYAKNIADGAGYVYYTGGPRTEGGTDFLWLLLISFFNLISIDPAIGALLLSSCATGIVALLFAQTLFREALPLSATWPYLLATSLVLLLPSACAGYIGFSAQFFSAGILLLYALNLDETQRHATKVPLLALLIGLIRPDGVIVGAGFVVLAWWRIRTTESHKRFLINLAVATLIGALYFVWRYHYFGQLLPLPLQVKSHAGTPFPTLAWTLRWLLAQNARYLVALVLLLLISKNLVAQSQRQWFAIGLAPLFLHLGAFACSDQSQNIAYRFQSPFVLVIFFAVCALLVKVTRSAISNGRSCTTALFILLLTLPDISAANDVWKLATRPEYIEQFSFELRMLLTPETKVALSEAGRMGYWHDAKLIDIVGLNNAETASHPPSLTFMRGADPDIVMFHHADTFSQPVERGGAVALKREAPLVDLLQPEFKSYYDSPPDSYSGVKINNVQLAPVLAARFLDESRDIYDVYLVKYYGKFDHVFAIKKTFPKHAEVISLLERSHHATDSVSYLRFIRHVNSHG